LQHCRTELKVGKGDRSFPKNQTVNALISKSRNKEWGLEDTVRRDSVHLLPHVSAMQDIASAYTVYKREKNLLDYDDLLFGLEDVLRSNAEALAYCRRRHSHIMVDEYQDTNPVQARIAGLVAGLVPTDPRDAAGAATGDSFEGAPPAPGRNNIMVVGDDAQSIYAFRGADVRNILRFPELFPGTRIIRLEENYRSTQPLLDLSNAVLAHASEGYGKHLFTRREGGAKPGIVRPMTDRSQAGFVTGRILELMRLYPPGEIAVLFRAGFHSYAVEVALGKVGLPFRKYGGIRYTEAAHVKDAMSFVRLVQNPLDYTAFMRMAELSKGVGPKTCLKLYQLAQAGDGKALAGAAQRYPVLAGDLMFIDAERQSGSGPALLLTKVVEHYRTRLEELFPDDYPRRLQGLEQLIQIAGSYDDLDLFIADLSLEDPTQEEEKSDSVVLSTIHSAKGLEWSAVLVIDLVEDRFPSRHALVRPEDYEEERRLMYVACTRAKDFLELYVPLSMYDKGSGGSIPATPSPFVRELGPELYAEWQENYGGGLVLKERRSASDRPARSPAPEYTRPASHFASGPVPEPVPFAVTESADALVQSFSPSLAAGGASAVPPAQCGYCQHRIFGRGKIVQHLPPDRYKVNFPGVGLKVIMAAYLSLEE
jgi:Superfamily I DNA and RNA helicases